MQPADRTGSPSQGALAGLRVVDVSGLAPGPFASMVLADHGAEVIAVERPGAGPISESFWWGKRSAVVDLKDQRGVEFVQKLCDSADVFLEGSRPGVMERLGLGPEVLLVRNPSLIYARLTGYGQNGPYATRAGHDVNYLAVAGPLGIVGNDEPVIPHNVLGDFASGALVAVVGILAGLLARHRTGVGQVVDAAIVDGAALLSTAQLVELNRGKWRGRGQSQLSGIAPFYSVYRCRDGRWFAVGAFEPKFYASLLQVLGLSDSAESQFDRSTWAATRDRIAEVFSQRDRDEWAEIFRGVDACAEPVMDLHELEDHPHLRARGVITRSGDQVAAGVAPRLSATPGARGVEPATLGCDTVPLLVESGLELADAVELARTWSSSRSERGLA